MHIHIHEVEQQVHVHIHEVKEQELRWRVLWMLWCCLAPQLGMFRVTQQQACGGEYAVWLWLLQPVYVWQPVAASW